MQFEMVFCLQHKTKMGEAEIQSAVEAAAVIFKKVVLQRRAAKKANEEGKLHYFFHFYGSNALQSNKNELEILQSLWFSVRHFLENHMKTQCVQNKSTNSTVSKWETMCINNNLCAVLVVT